MNTTEHKLLMLLEKGRAEYGFVALKAEFEAEGTRREELTRLSGICRRAGLALAVKIGGCEALTDCWDCRTFGAEYVIAPMIESRYALQKYIGTIKKAFPDGRRYGAEFLFNVETISCFDLLHEMQSTLLQDGSPVSGVVFGRVDFAGSLGLTRDRIEGPELQRYYLEVARYCADNGLVLVVGGGISAGSIDNLRTVKTVGLNRFETRKVVFDSRILETDLCHEALRCAIEAELLWLECKRDHYLDMAHEDRGRIDMLTQRVLQANHVDAA